MTLPNASATFRDSGPGWVYWLIDISDPTGKTRSSDQDTPTFTRDVAGNPFDTDTIYLAASSHPILGDGLVPFRFDAITGLPVIIGGSVDGSGAPFGNGNTIGGYTVQITNPADGQSLTFYTLPNGQKVLINTRPPTFDALTKESPLLASDYATANNPAITGLLAALTTPAGPILRQMLGEELLAYLLAEAPGRLGLNEVMARNPVALYNLLLGATANLILLQSVDGRDAKGVFYGTELPGEVKYNNSMLWRHWLGEFALTVDGTLRQYITKDAFSLLHELVKVSGDLVARSLSVSSIPIAERIDHVPVMVADGKGGATTKYLTPFEFARQIGLASSRPQPVARYVECYDEYDTQSGPMTISPAKIGQPQPHTLHLPASQIFGRISYPDGQPAGGYSLTYPSLDTFQVNDAGAGGGETSDLIVELTKRTS